MRQQRRANENGDNRSFSAISSVSSSSVSGRRLLGFNALEKLEPNSGQLRVLLVLPVLAVANATVGGWRRRSVGVAERGKIFFVRVDSMLAGVVDDGGGLRSGGEKWGGGGVRQHFTGAAAALVGLWRDVSRNIFFKSICWFMLVRLQQMDEDAIYVKPYHWQHEAWSHIATTTTITITHQNHDVDLMHISFDRRQHVAGVLVNPLPRNS
jgi:hypothetical protein